MGDVNRDVSNTKGTKQTEVETKGNDPPSLRRWRDEEGRMRRVEGGDYPRWCRCRGWGRLVV